MTQQTRLDLGNPHREAAHDKSEIARALLDWYDVHARVLPWRVSSKDRAKGIKPDPYRVWLSEIMLQQTTVATVKTRFLDFTQTWPTVMAMAGAPREDILGAWAGLGYYARARNLHACAQIIANDHKGVFPQTQENLRTLPGIGDYTAAAIAAIAFDRRAIVLDGNIERVTARLYAESTPLPKAKPVLKKLTDRYWPDDKANARHGDFAQALMDLGSTICKPKAPLCDLCPIRGACTAFATGQPQEFPVKPARKIKPTRRGFVFIVENARGEIAAEQRPDDGLLGGMLGLPGSDWQVQSTEQLPNWSGALADPPDNLHAVYEHDIPIGRIRHSFTHFHLDLDVYYHRWRARRGLPPGLNWYAPAAKSLPTVMQKAVDCWRAWSAHQD